jgi:cytoskeletal protein CcmA (bactofilin family)
VWKGIGKDKEPEKDESIELIGMEERAVPQPSMQPQPFQSGMHHPKTFPKSTHIGSGIAFRGEVTGKEDLEVEGRFEGKIQLPGCTVSIGKDGEVNAEVAAKTVSIHGKLVGNVVVSDKVEIFEMGSMEGDIVSPRIQIADGAKFKGSVDTQHPHKEAQAQPEHKEGLSTVSKKGP